MSETANPSRERILSRIHRALENKTPAPVGEFRSLFPPVGNLLDRFASECAANITECLITENSHTTCARLQQLLEELPDGELFAEDTAELRGLLHGVGRPVRWSTDGPPHETSQATITRCEALLALTGSVLTSSACGGRGASIVAPTHIVVARESQIVPDLDSVLELVNTRKLPQSSSFVGLITGCSRTGDIEKKLVIGAHGPRRLVVIVERHS